LKKLLAILTAYVLVSQFSFAQQTFRDLKSFESLVGSWIGYLEYLDYGNNTKKIQLPAKLFCIKSELGEALILNYIFQDPGHVLENIQLLTLNNDGNLVLTNFDNGIANSETLNISLYESREDLSLLLIFIDSEYDDNKPATVRYTINISSETFSSIKEVKYGEGEFFFRNEIKLNKEKDE
jgi:hypothetical protein